MNFMKISLLAILAKMAKTGQNTRESLFKWPFWGGPKLGGVDTLLDKVTFWPPSFWGSKMTSFLDHFLVQKWGQHLDTLLGGNHCFWRPTLSHYWTIFGSNPGPYIWVILGPQIWTDSKSPKKWLFQSAGPKIPKWHIFSTFSRLFPKTGDFHEFMASSHESDHIIGQKVVKKWSKRTLFCGPEIPEKRQFLKGIPMN